MNEHVNGGKKMQGVALSPADAAALDAVLARRAAPRIDLAGAAEVTAEGVADPAREARVQGWLNVVGGAALPAPSADLLQRTLGAVENDRMKIQHAGRGEATPTVAPAAPRRWSHLREVAAMFVAAAILGAVLIPAISQARQSYRRTLCATNMASIATGFGTYAAAYEHALPCLAPSADGNWLHPTPTGHTNTANLLPLLNASYITPVNLVCAGRGLGQGAAATPTRNDIRNCSYSYVNLFGGYKPTWNGSSAVIVLADRNPLFAGSANPELNSFNHQGKGTYLLHADGHVTWEISPNVGFAHDNIWTIGSASNHPTSYVGTEVTTSPGDTFLSP